ncbi:MAG: hypothetical protein ACMUIG_03225 [Thermoplasmatota archaeon]
MTESLDRSCTVILRLTLFTAVLIFATPIFHGETDAVGGVDIVLNLDREYTGSTEDDMIDVSRSGYQDIFIHGNMTISSQTPHVIQRVSVFLNVAHIEPDIVDDEDIDMEVDPRAINLMGVRPGREYDFEIEIRIRVDNWVPGGENLFSLEGAWSVTPAVTQQSGQMTPESFYIFSKPFYDGYLDGPDEVEVPVDSGTVFTVDMYNTGNTVPDFFPDLDPLASRASGFMVSRGDAAVTDRIEHDKRSGYVDYTVDAIDPDDVVPGIRSSIRIVLQGLDEASSKDGEMSGIKDLHTIHIDLVFVKGGGGIDPPSDDDPPDDDMNPDDDDDSDDHVEADIDIMITQAYNRHLANDDTVLKEVIIQGTTSGCEMLWLGVEVPFISGSIISWTDQEFDIKESPDPFGLSDLYEEAYFRDTSQNGDWSSFEYVLRVELDMSEIEGFDRDEYLRTAGDMAPDRYYVRAFPDSGSEKVYSEEMVEIPVTTGVLDTDEGSGNTLLLIGVVGGIVTLLILLIGGLLVFAKRSR